MMQFFKPQSCRYIAASLNEIIKRWDAMSPEERAAGDYINPDEPIVLKVPNPEWEGEENEYGEDENGNPKHLAFHILSHGGGADVDEDGDACGHDGFQLTGMEMDYDKFDGNGRRMKGK